MLKLAGILAAASPAIYMLWGFFALIWSAF